MSKSRILIADDDKLIRDTIARYCKTYGFEVITASNGQEAVETEENLRPDLVILDVEMPVMNGFKACQIIREKRSGVNYIPIIFLSGLLLEESVIAGLELGADDYIRKPFEPLELLTRITNLLKIKKLIAQVETLENTVFSLVKSIEARDFYTAGHSRRVADMSVNIGKEIGVSEEEVEILNKSSLLHDIGKMGIPDQILNKQGSLTNEEFDFIKKHPVLGVDICSNLRLVPQILDIIHHHHEKLDGSGYPDGLPAEEISRLVRIVTIADIFDALTTDRPYRVSKTNTEAIFILKKEAQENKLDIDFVQFVEDFLQKNSK